MCSFAIICVFQYKITKSVIDEGFKVHKINIKIAKSYTYIYISYVHLGYGGSKAGNRSSGSVGVPHLRSRSCR